MCTRRSGGFKAIDSERTRNLDRVRRGSHAHACLQLFSAHHLASNCQCQSWLATFRSAPRSTVQARRQSMRYVCSPRKQSLGRLAKTSHTQASRKKSLKLRSRKSILPIELLHCSSATQTCNILSELRNIAHARQQQLMARVPNKGHATQFF